MKKSLIGFAVLAAFAVWGTVSAFAETEGFRYVSDADPSAPAGSALVSDFGGSALAGNAFVTDFASYKLAGPASENESCESCQSRSWLDGIRNGCVGDGCGVPNWTARLGVLTLTRSRPRDAVLVTNSYNPGGATLMSGGDFGFTTAPSLDVALTRHGVFGTDWDLEAIYAGFDSFVGRVDAFYAPNGAVVHFVSPVGNVVFPAIVSGSYRSDLHSIEINGKRPLDDRFTFIGGFRYLDLSEQSLSLRQDVGPNLNLATYSIGAQNRLSGAQIGLDTKLLRWDRFELGSLVKAGVYSNDAANSALITQNIGASFASSAAANHAAFVGELGLTGAYQVSDRVLFRAGYQFMWVDGVALASDQVAVSDPLNSAATVYQHGTVFYHGASAGLEMHW